MMCKEFFRTDHRKFLILGILVFIALLWYYNLEKIGKYEMGEPIDLSVLIVNSGFNRLKRGDIPLLKFDLVPEEFATEENKVKILEIVQPFVKPFDGQNYQVIYGNILSESKIPLYQSYKHVFRVEIQATFASSLNYPASPYYNGDDYRFLVGLDQNGNFTLLEKYVRGRSLKENVKNDALKLAKRYLPILFCKYSSVEWVPAWLVDEAKNANNDIIEVEYDCPPGLINWLKWNCRSVHVTLDLFRKKIVGTSEEIFYCGWME